MVLLQQTHTWERTIHMFSYTPTIQVDCKRIVWPRVFLDSTQKIIFELAWNKWNLACDRAWEWVTWRTWQFSFAKLSEQLFSTTNNSDWCECQIEEMQLFDHHTGGLLITCTDKIQSKCAIIDIEKKYEVTLISWQSAWWLYWLYNTHIVQGRPNVIEHISWCRPCSQEKWSRVALYILMRSPWHL